MLCFDGREMDRIMLHANSRLRPLGIAALLCGSLLAGCARRGAVATTPLKPSQTPPTAVAPSGGGQLFAEPRDAVAALVAACHSGDENQVVAVFGEQARSLVSTGNAERDRERCLRFTTSAKQMTRIDPDAPGRAHVVVGHDDWRLPIPLVQTTGGWQFDSVAGAKAVAARRVGANELETIRVLRAYVSAQREFEGSHGSPARRFSSTPGRRDGLAWPKRRGQRPSPFAPSFGKALQGGSWAGYRYRILPARADLDGGFGAVAWPASPGESGVATFAVDGSGRIWEKDLGASTAEQAAAISAVPPGEGWKPVPK
jgi:hypothetical protein